MPAHSRRHSSPMAIVVAFVLHSARPPACEAFQHHVRLGTTPRRRPGVPELRAIDAGLAATLGETASLPVLFVGSGTYFLSKKKEEEEESVTATGEDGEIDVYRDTALRYAGYANEVGEAFRPLVPAWVVPASYGVAVTYVFADTVDKTIKAFGSSKYMSSATTTCALLEGLDAFLWQITASVALPGFTIHQVVEISQTVIDALELRDAANAVGAASLVDAAPTALGLVTIPFIVKPLDELAEKLMDFTLRKLWEPYLQSCTIDYGD